MIAQAFAWVFYLATFIPSENSILFKNYTLRQI
jgi:hypothetical protein